MNINQLLSALSTKVGSAFKDPTNIIYWPGKGYLLGFGTVLPTAAEWARGAIFVKIDGAADQNLYINEAAAGEGTAPSWVAQIT